MIIVRGRRRRDAEEMDLVAGAGGMFGQLAVGLAGGIPGEAMPGLSNAVSKIAKVGAKATIDSLPDKVRQVDFVQVD